MKKYDIYEEGFQIMGGSAKAHYLGYGYGNTFEEACEDYIKRTGQGEKRHYTTGKVYYCDWGCRWFPTLEEAQESFG